VWARAYGGKYARYGTAPAWLPTNVASRKGNANRILAFRLDGSATLVSPNLAPPGSIPQPPAQTGTDVDIAAGGANFEANCVGRHTNTWPAPIRDLRRTSAATHAGLRDKLRFLLRILSATVESRAGLPGLPGSRNYIGGSRCPI